MPKADLVLEGGGVKGLGLVGAVLHLMREGYTFPRVAGTSAGSIVAAFLAAGATADELAAIMDRLEYPRVPDRAGPPGIGESLGLVRHSGAHPGNYIHGFVRDELERLGVSTFGDLEAAHARGDGDRHHTRTPAAPAVGLRVARARPRRAARRRRGPRLDLDPAVLRARPAGGPDARGRRRPVELPDRDVRPAEAALADLRREGHSRRARRERPALPRPFPAPAAAGSPAGARDDDGGPRARPDLPRAAVRPPPRHPGRHERRRGRRVRVQ